MSQSVLLTDGLLRKSLAATRSIGRTGMSVVVGDSSPVTLAGRSKYCDRRVRYPNPEDGEVFANWLLRELETSHYDVFLPMDDQTMDVAVARQEEMKPLVATLLPKEPVYHMMRDKFRAAQVASDFGFLVPRTTRLSGYADTSAANPLADGDAKYPMVVKPTRASGSRGLRVVSSQTDFQNLKAVLQLSKLCDDDAWMAQRYIEPGERIDVCLLADHQSRVVASFAQKELRHFPYPHGPSTAQESVHAPALVEQCSTLASNMGWRGIIEFEFMREEGRGQLYFMETNTRFWNSLHLAIVCGVNFPRMYVDLALKRTVTPVHHYPARIRCRSLLPADLCYFANAVFRPEMVRRSEARSRKAVDDILSKDDLRPTMGFLSAALYYAWQPPMWRDLFRR